ncbi:alpha-1,6-mannosyltransferase [Sphingomonas insulae]|uniref:Glycosyltransferase family 1 protein n=1 Tax=Sphingomonas insulae TaxID=424800 RepID=A0ABN1HXR3_9SPHN|nr:glycosyltransferase [Sphingomonas insulae]NIJ29825.1 alpha-1,6-mannosyltransferase [Sphingomonas insulae]
MLMTHGGGCDRRPLLVCDLTQSYSTTGGGGISTYLREKRDYVLGHTPHHLLQIVPGDADRVSVNGRHIFAEVAADPVRGSPNYRFILRVAAVRRLLAEYQPDIIESLCPWVLPWTAIRHRRAFPATALVAGYRTDFPNAHVDRVAGALFGPMGKLFYWLSLGYAEITYREFDRVYTLGDEARETLRRRGITRTDVLPLGVDTQLFHPTRRDSNYRSSIGLPGSGPLLIYAGRIDNEKRADRLVAMMRQLPQDLGAALVMIGDGKLKASLQNDAADLPIAFTGFETDRSSLAKALASADLYVSAMADETFGISIIEAQASGLPVVGVAGGAMPARVPTEIGRLGPVDDVATMAANVMHLWQGDLAAMRVSARAHVERHFSWQRTFEQLFDGIYPQALACAAARVEAKSSRRMAAIG